MHLPSVPRPPRAIACVSIALLALPFVALACDGGGDPSPTPQAVVTTENGTVVAAPTATPTRAPADADLGARLRYEGDFEGAIAVYAAIAQEKTGEEQQAARLSQAQLLYRANRLEETRDALGSYLFAAGSDGDGSSARFMFASVLDDLGDAEGALASYDTYIAAGGVASSYAQIERAKMLARLARVDEAEAAAEAVMALPLDQSFRDSFLVSIGAAFEQAGAEANALAWYERAAARGPAGLAAAASVKQRLGDPSWVDDYAAVVASYPASAPASTALAALDAAGVPVSSYARGVVHYRAFRNEPARAAFAEAIAAGDNAAEAYYYTAAIDERYDNFGPAIDNYARAYELNPASFLADDALWWRGRLLETTGRYDEAATVFATLAEQYPHSEWAHDANFHRGLVLYRAGNFQGAAFAWGAIAPHAPRGEERARALFWQGRAEIAAGIDAGKQTLETLVATEPGSFYALRAEVLLGKNDTRRRDADVQRDANDWDAIAAFFVEEYGVDPGALPLADDPRWAEAEELEAAGLRGPSDGVFRTIVFDPDNSMLDLYRITRRLDEDGRPGLAARAAVTLISRLRSDGRGEPPLALLRVAYPPAFGDLAGDAADEYGVPPTLLLALVRQESFFDPDAGSHAGALGLTQVIEPTGNAIAVALGVENFTVDDLFRPRLSLRFGASYLADQLLQFDGNVYHALAAYNGGPGTAMNAIESSGGDLDLFVEDLEFDETRLYVKLVMENYARYRHLYEGLDRPSLPQ